MKGPVCLSHACACLRLTCMYGTTASLTKVHVLANQLQAAAILPAVSDIVPVLYEPALQIPQLLQC